MAVDAVVNAYREFMDQRVALMNAADDPALKQHFQYEIDAIEQTIAAMSEGASSGGVSEAVAGNELPDDDGQVAPPLNLPDEVAGTQFNAAAEVDAGTEMDAGTEIDTGTEVLPPDAGLPDDNLIDNKTAVGGVFKETPVTEEITETSSETTESSSGSEGGSLGPGLPSALEPYRNAIIAAAETTGVPADLIAAVAWKETRGNHDAFLSPSAAMGLMQVDPGTFDTGPDSLVSRHPELAGGNLTDAATNILAGAFELKDQYDSLGSWDLSLRAYNSGANNVNPNDLSDVTMADGKVTGTANYVELVNAYWQIISTGNGQLVDNPEGMVPG